jgi:hypothetical protein
MSSITIKIEKYNKKIISNPVIITITTNNYATATTICTIAFVL